MQRVTFCHFQSVVIQATQNRLVNYSNINLVAGWIALEADFLEWLLPGLSRVDGGSKRELFLPFHYLSCR